MTIITMPLTLITGPGTGVQQLRYDMTEASDVTGDDAVRVFGPPRWRLMLASIANMGMTDASAWETMLFGLRGSVNTLAAFDPGRPTTRGTLTGTPTLLNAAVAGDTSATLAVGSAGTLLTGDWLQVGTGLGTSQLVKLTSDSATVSLHNAVTFEPPLRKGYSAGTACTVDHALSYYRLTSTGSGGQYVAGFQAMGGFSADLIERFA